MSSNHPYYVVVLKSQHTIHVKLYVKIIIFCAKLLNYDQIIFRLYQTLSLFLNLLPGQIGFKEIYINAESFFKDHNIRMQRLATW